MRNEVGMTSDAGSDEPLSMLSRQKHVVCVDEPSRRSHGFRTVLHTGKVELYASEYLQKHF